MNADTQPQPVTIKLHKRSKLLELEFNDGAVFNLPCEYLRVYSPSAEVQGHGPGQGTLQLGKEQVNISLIEPVGNYAIRLHFDDGHNTGLFTWHYLYQLGRDYAEKWQAYLDALKAAGYEHGGFMQTHKPELKS